MIKALGVRMLTHIQEIVEAVSNSYGDEFFNKITFSLSNVIKADYTFIALLDKEADCAKTITLVAKGALIDNIEYSLKGTPALMLLMIQSIITPKMYVLLFPTINFFWI